ncbi:DUF2971 domain-containing protein [Enterobacter pseudoroggenkampii]|uniref:DUF2971 domain-containing protein n=1 Tax=Enterobacter pseudoroggenkampii TaxID=2996112 RepID=UPI002264BE69|nr:DUF2971 domain-containing protein [Enterobacter pseudoroggenkampii]MCX8287921.1 DUF2971 domain-containing protein [Enterobacter pseudoroggenkampii]
MGIFHYTDLNGFKGIVENSCLWATNIHFMNDKNEYTHGILCFRNALKYLEGSELSNALEISLKSAISKYDDYELMKHEAARHVYSISFCRGIDKLSQWRGYGNSQGISLEFDEFALIDGVEKDSAFFRHGDVIYTDEKNTVEVNKKIIDFFSEFSDYFLKDKKNEGSRYSNSFTRFITANLLMESSIPFLKNYGFSEENEFRFVFSRGIGMPKVNFRVGAYGLIPYLNIRMKDDKKLPIAKVVIGPAKDKEMIYLGVRMILDANGYNDVQIEFSTVPYRG